MKRLMGFMAAVACLYLVVGCAQQQKKPAPKPQVGLQRIHFDFDRSNIKSEYEPVLQNNAEWMRQHSKSSVRIEGNCDERGSIEYNIALGDRRANSAKNYLMNLGIPGSRLTTVSYGEERPLCTQHTESCWWQNRRDDFVSY